MQEIYRSLIIIIIIIIIIIVVVVVVVIIIFPRLANTGLMSSGGQSDFIGRRILLSLG